MCAPGVGVLVERYRGFKKGMAGTRYKISDPFDVNTENTANYGAWENLAGANPETVAIVGLCFNGYAEPGEAQSADQKPVAHRRLRSGPRDARRCKAGTVQVVLGQHPYLQGYLPVVALARHLRDKQPLPQGWIDIGTEVVTRENVDSIYGRETDGPRKQTQWYAELHRPAFCRFERRGQAAAERARKCISRRYCRDPKYSMVDAPLSNSMAFENALAA